MANLLSQNIGTNYKSILNLDATTINTPLDATLRAVTDGAGTASLLQLSTEAVGISRTVNLSAGATNPRLFNVAYTINNSGAQTGTLTGIFLNATEPALNGMTHNLMDMQVGGVSKFLVNRLGTLTLLGNVNASGALSGNLLSFNGLGEFLAQSDGVFTVRNNAGTSFNRLQLGGTTSSFPSIKRNGAAIDFRLADDSGYCSIGVKDINIYGAGAGIYSNNNDMLISSSYVRVISSRGWHIGDGSYSPESAILELKSTVKGFLMPRQTTAQINAIATPANGLQVYNTDLAQPCFYDGLGWRKVSHTNM